MHDMQNPPRGVAARGIFFVSALRYRAFW